VSESIPGPILGPRSAYSDSWEEFARRLHARARPKPEPEEATAGREEDVENRDKTMPPTVPEEPSFPPPTAGADVDLTRSTGGFIGLGSLLARKLAPLRFLVTHLLVDEGGGFIAGEEKAGKTLFALDIALCMVLGLPVGGHFAVPDTLRVLFIEEEDSLRRTWRRIRKMLRGFGLDPDDPALQAELNDHFRISVWSGVDLDDPVWWNCIATEVEAHRPATKTEAIHRRYAIAEEGMLREAGDKLERFHTSVGPTEGLGPFSAPVVPLRPERRPEAAL
jgi:hypothetical protein